MKIIYNIIDKKTTLQVSAIFDIFAEGKSPLERAKRNAQRYANTYNKPFIIAHINGTEPIEVSPNILPWEETS